MQQQAEKQLAKKDLSREELQAALNKAEVALASTQKNLSGAGSKELWSKLLAEAPKGFAAAMKKAAKEEDSSRRGEEGDRPGTEPLFELELLRDR